jgi:hypothetical protein
VILSRITAPVRETIESLGSKHALDYSKKVGRRLKQVGTSKNMRAQNSFRIVVDSVLLLDAEGNQERDNQI